MQGVRTHLYFWPDLGGSGVHGGMVILTNGEGPYEDIEEALEEVVREAAAARAGRTPVSASGDVDGDIGVEDPPARDR